MGIAIASGVPPAQGLVTGIVGGIVIGMLAGLGVLILASQFHVMVDDTPRKGGLANLLSIPEAIQSLHKYSRWEVAVYATTLLTIVVTDLLTGVVAGISLALARVIVSLAHLEVRVDTAADGVVNLNLAGAATFISLPKLATAFAGLQRGQVVTVHLESLLFLDHACLQALEEFARLYERQGGTVSMEWKALSQFSVNDRMRLVS